MTVSINDKLRKYKSLFSTTLATGIGTGTGDTITLSSVSGLPTDTPITLTFDRVDSGGVATPTKMERIRGIISGSNFTAYVRGKDGTTEQAHTGGAVIEMIWNADDLNDMIDWATTQHNQDGTHTSGLITTLKATSSEITTGTEDAKLVTPKGLKDAGITSMSKATSSDVATATDDAKYVTSLAVAPYGYTSMARQAIMNGNFDVWQRGVSVALADITLAYQADRWADYANKNGGTLPTLTRSRVALTPGTLSNAFYATRLTTNGAGTSLGVSSFHEYFERIEHGTRLLCGNGKKVTVSFWARSDIANKKIGISLGQAYGTGGSPTSTETIAGTSFTLTSTLTKYTYTFTTNTLTGKTFGTANDDYIEVDFWYMWGDTVGDGFGLTGAETYVGSGYIDIAQVQLCAGDVALPFQPKSYAQELAECERYLYRISASSGSPYQRYGMGQATAATTGGAWISFPVKMRTTPTFSIGGNYAITANVGSVIAGTSATVASNGDSPEGCYIDVGVAGGLTAGNATVMLANNDSTGYIQFEAEL